MLKAKNEHRGYCRNTSDFPTVDRALAGEQSAYEELFQKYRRKIFQRFLTLTEYNELDSEDFVQETFALAFSKLNTFKKNASFYTWLYRIAVNVFLMNCRRKRPCFISIEELLGQQRTTDVKLVVEGMSSNYSREGGDKKSDIGTLDYALENMLNKILVSQLMRNLPPGYKKMLELRDLQGFEYKEIAAQLRCSPGNVKSQRHRAIMKLRAEMQITHT